MVRSVALISMLFVGCGFTASPDTHSGVDAGSGRPTGGSGGSGTVDDAAPGTADAATPDAKLDPCGGQDDDHDGVCNSDDDWPCGPKPSDPGEDRDLTGQPDGNGRLQLQNIDVSGGGGGGFGNHATGGSRRIVVQSDDTIGLALQYTLKDTGCPGNCIDQIEYGLMPDRDGCLFDDVVSKSSGVSGQSSVTLSAPNVAEPTQYELRVHVGRNFSCTYNGAHAWYQGSPPSGNTIAYVCVRD